MLLISGLALGCGTFAITSDWIINPGGADDLTHVVGLGCGPNRNPSGAVVFSNPGPHAISIDFGPELNLDRMTVQPAIPFTAHLGADESVVLWIEAEDSTVDDWLTVVHGPGHGRELRVKAGGDVDNDDDGAVVHLGCGPVPNLPLDCEDHDDRVFPGATEVEDGVDNDCDGDIDEAE